MNVYTFTSFHLSATSLHEQVLQQYEHQVEHMSHELLSALGNGTLTFDFQYLPFTFQFWEHMSLSFLARAGAQQLQAWLMS